MYIRHIVSALVLSFVNCANDTTISHENLTTNEKIVGGKKVKIEDFPYQLSLELNDHHICGASMIGDRWALTAAHCTYNFPAGNLSIRAGTSYREYGGEVIDVKRVHEHPGYGKKSDDHDIAILELVSPITTKKASTIPLASWYNFLFPWLRGISTGWGDTEEGGYLSRQLQAVIVPLVNFYRCSLVYDKMLTGNMFCAGEEDKDSCQGDSGGPFVINDKVYGIVSFGNGCGRPNFPGVYTRVANYRSFIYEVSGV